MASKIQQTLEKLKEKEAQSASQKSINKALSKLKEKEHKDAPFALLETHLEKDSQKKSRLQRQITLGISAVVILSISWYSYFAHQRTQEQLQTAKTQILQLKSLAEQHAQDTGSFIQLTPQTLESSMFDAKLPFGATIQFQSNMDGSVVELLVKSSPKDACQSLMQSLFSEFDFIEVDQQRAQSAEEAVDFCTTSGQNALSLYLVNRVQFIPETPSQGAPGAVSAQEEFLPLRPPIEPQRDPTTEPQSAIPNNSLTPSLSQPAAPMPSLSGTN